MPPRTSTTVRYTIPHLRRLGYTAAQVEKFNAYTKTRHDLFGFIDVLAFKPPSHDLLFSAAVSLHPDQFHLFGCLGIQACAGQGALQSHIDKFLSSPENLEGWLASGNRFEIWSWHPRAQRNPDGSFATYKNGNRKPKTMQPRFVRFSLSSRKQLLISHGESETLTPIT